MSSDAHNLAFERLVQPHLDRLYRLAWRLAGSKAEAEDLFQELLIKAYGKLDDLAHIEQPGPWLCRMMYNLFIDEKRRFTRRRMQTIEEGQLGDDGMASLAASGSAADDPVASLDVSLLQNHLIEPLLGVKDPRVDKRIDFVGGIRGLAELERRVDSGHAAVAFALFPTRMSALMAVADANALMPPKSTWFEPKLADGLLSHVLD